MVRITSIVLVFATLLLAAEASLRGLQVQSPENKTAVVVSESEPVDFGGNNGGNDDHDHHDWHNHNDDHDHHNDDWRHNGGGGGSWGGNGGGWNCGRCDYWDYNSCVSGHNWCWWDWGHNRCYCS